jgi:4'-phosphopantetheinyl transferase
MRFMIRKGLETTRRVEIAAELPPLAAGIVQVWVFRVSACLPALPHLQHLLSREERQRHSRFAVAADRHRFVLGRGTLRLLIGWCTGTRPEEVEFSQTPEGKPFLVGERSSDGLEFNVSHSSDIVACALTRGSSVGVDVELMRAVPKMEQIVDQFFAAEESRVFREAAAADRIRCFFRAWTRKEAFVKALGVGLSRDLKSFAVSLNPDESIRVLRNDAENAGAESVVFYELPIDGEYVATLAIKGVPPRVQLIEGSRNLIIGPDPR